MITGYRRYNVDARGVLRGAHDDWEGREFQAMCYESVDRCEKHLKNENVASCACGIYVLKGPDIIMDYHQWPVLAAVIGWGAYIEYEYGWRIQHTRIEHLWIEPASRLDGWIAALNKRYQVGVEIRQNAICCGQAHEMGYWPSKAGPISICEMETSHIVNALRFINKHRIGAASQWTALFERELKRRAPQMVDGRIKVVF